MGSRATAYRVLEQTMVVIIRFSLQESVHMLSAAFLHARECLKCAGNRRLLISLN
jgi:hypothetical protein